MDISASYVTRNVLSTILTINDDDPRDELSIYSDRIDNTGQHFSKRNERIEKSGNGVLGVTKNANVFTIGNELDAGLTISNATACYIAEIIVIARTLTAEETTRIVYDLGQQWKNYVGY